MNEIFINVIFILLIFCGYIYFKTKKELKNKQDLINKISNTKIPTIIGKIDIFSKEDTEHLAKDKTATRLVLKYLAYEIAINTDKMRTMEDAKYYVGYLNCLHKQYMFFDKLNKQEEKEDEKYSGQDLR